MNPLLSQLVLVVNLLLAGHGRAQQLQIIRADGRLFESITVGQFMVVELPDRFQSAKRYQGQLT